MLVVNSEPHADDDMVLEPLQSRGGKMFRNCLTEAEWLDYDLIVTHAVKCYGEKPTASEIKTCAGWLKQEVEYAKPKLILALGTVAARAVFGKPLTIKSHGGEIFTSESFGTMAALWHPPHKLVEGGSNLTNQTIEFLKKLKDFCYA
jgi:uracil-DNA glycosylase family 4